MPDSTKGEHRPAELTAVRRAISSPAPTLAHLPRCQVSGAGAEMAIRNLGSAKEPALQAHS
jgi:hypothetical protein